MTKSRSTLTVSSKWIVSCDNHLIHHDVHNSSFSLQASPLDDEISGVVPVGSKLDDPDMFSSSTGSDVILDHRPQHTEDEDDGQMDCGDYPESHGFSSSTSGSSVSEDSEPAALDGLDCPKNDNQVRLMGPGQT